MIVKKVIFFLCNVFIKKMPRFLSIVSKDINEHSRYMFREMDFSFCF